MGQGGNPQHFAEPLRDDKLLRDSPTSGQTGKDIMDTMSFLHHEAQKPFAAGDSLLENPYSGSPVEKEDYSLEDEVIRHKTPSPDPFSEPLKTKPAHFDDPLDDFGFSPKGNVAQPIHDTLEDFLSKPESEPTPAVVREPSPVPVREPSPLPVREPSPVPVRQPKPVREPTPVRDPTPEPPKPKATPIPTFLESEFVEKKPEKKEPEPKPVISKPTSPPPAPPKQVSTGETKSCDGLGESLLFNYRLCWWRTSCCFYRLAVSERFTSAVVCIS
ncbi:hypothetical protein ONE63_004863 [Megalurothrips usitatus]|uniref:Uncharacterized protein n=1 Tax=Megalurothrips usitatus TaxID=439358 RepID=A0AAV7X491_9NEOP|nr:hypothetical protein ONE63_004863 [Megalurothrips usitatus]